MVIWGCLGRRKRTVVGLVLGQDAHDRQVRGLTNGSGLVDAKVLGQALGGLACDARGAIDRAIAEAELAHGRAGWHAECWNWISQRYPDVGFGSTESTPGYTAATRHGLRI